MLKEFDLNELDMKVIEETKKKIEHKMTCLSLEMPLAASSNLLDLRTDNNRNYLIFLHKTNTVVGSISYRGYHVSDYSGDVEAFIIPYYRGCGYAYEALRLLSHILYEDNIFDFWVSSYKDNIPSIKTIEKFDNKVISPSNHSDKNIILYECKTCPIKINTKIHKRINIGN